MLLSERDADRQGPATLIDVLNHLVVRKASGAAMDIPQPQEGVVARRMPQHEIGQKFEFLPTHQHRPGGGDR
jgi:hypothetical protein